MNELAFPPCLARRRVIDTAAAVDHADTELIGHRGWEGNGFLCGEKQLRLKLLFVFMKAITLRHVSNCHFGRSKVEPQNLLPPCSPLYWPHSIERNAGSFLWKELGWVLSIGPRNFLKIFLPGGKKIEPQTILVSEGWRDLMRWWIPFPKCFLPHPR